MDLVQILGDDSRHQVWLEAIRLLSLEGSEIDKPHGDLPLCWAEQQGEPFSVDPRRTGGPR